MNVWVRVLAVVAAVILAALVLKSLPAILVLALLIGGVAFVNRRLRRPAGKAARSGAELLGLSREERDPFGILGYPLALFARTEDPAIDELVWGRWQGLDVRVFAMSFAAPTLLERGERTSFGCAMSQVDASLPALVVEPQLFVTLTERPPAAPRFRSGDERFEGVMNVWCEDPAFGRELLDSSLREWLRSLDPGWGIEVGGKIVMVYGPRPQRPDVVPILETLKDLLERLPKDLLAAHPPAV